MKGALKECVECGTHYRRGGRSAIQWATSQFCSNDCQRANRTGRDWNIAMSTTNERGCWLWPTRGHRFGYGKVQIDGVPMGAHRASWIKYRGDPGDLHVLHKCDVPRCINPDHLFLGTMADNMRDKTEKGRCPTGPTHPRAYLPAERFARGERQGFAKLTDAKVREILEKRPTHSLMQLAREYNVTKACVLAITMGRSWKHVPRPVKQ